MPRKCAFLGPSFRKFSRFAGIFVFGHVLKFGWVRSKGYRVKGI